MTGATIIGAVSTRRLMSSRWNVVHAPALAAPEPPAFHKQVARADGQVRKLARARRDLLRGREERIIERVVRADRLAPDRAEGFEELGREAVRLEKWHL